jgi:biopolymer transport protein ExbB
MNNIIVFFKTGGIVMLPLSIIAIALLTIMIDKLFFYHKHLKINKNLENIIYQPQFCYQTWQNCIKNLSAQNFYFILWQLIDLNNDKHNKKILENQAISLIKKIEKQMFSRIWIVETIVSVAPLLGLLGTIIGMSASFKILGSNNQINQSGITSGVAESLIATAFGLVVAIIALFFFNLWQRLANHTIDNLEIITTKLIDNTKING